MNAYHHHDVHKWITKKQFQQNGVIKIVFLCFSDRTFKETRFLILIVLFDQKKERREILLSKWQMFHP